MLWSKAPDMQLQWGEDVLRILVSKDSVCHDMEHMAEQFQVTEAGRVGGDGGCSHHGGPGNKQHRDQELDVTFKGLLLLIFCNQEGLTSPVSIAFQKSNYHQPWKGHSKHKSVGNIADSNRNSYHMTHQLCSQVCI